MLLFLKPSDDEKVLVFTIKKFLKFLSMNNSILEITMNFTFNGFDFLGWHLKVYKNNFLSCTPSSDNYNSFLKRIKLIINNSNYGAVRIIF